jgi:aminoglycoside phosphotransferase family enzyme
METEQEEFEETLDNLAITVGGFHTFDDLNRYEEIAVDVESVNQRIQDCVE